MAKPVNTATLAAFALCGSDAPSIGNAASELMTPQNAVAAFGRDATVRLFTRNTVPSASYFNMAALSFAIFFTSDALNARAHSAVVSEYTGVFDHLFDTSDADAFAYDAFAYGSDTVEALLQETLINTSAGTMQAETSLF